MGTSSGVPIKKGVMEAISVTTSIGKGKEKKIKQVVVKRVLGTRESGPLFSWKGSWPPSFPKDLSED